MVSMTMNRPVNMLDAATLGTATNPYVYSRRTHIYEIGAGDGAVHTLDIAESPSDRLDDIINTAVDIRLCDTCYQEYMLHGRGDYTKLQAHVCQEIEDDPAERNLDLPCDCPCAFRAKEMLRMALGRRCEVAGHDHRMKLCSVHGYGLVHWYCGQLHPNGSDHEIRARVRGVKTI